MLASVIIKEEAMEAEIPDDSDWMKYHERNLKVDVSKHLPGSQSGFTVTDSGESKVSQFTTPSVGMTEDLTAKETPETSNKLGKIKKKVSRFRDSVNPCSTKNEASLIEKCSEEFGLDDTSDSGGSLSAVADIVKSVNSFSLDDVNKIWNPQMEFTHQARIEAISPTFAGPKENLMIRKPRRTQRLETKTVDKAAIPEMTSVQNTPARYSRADTSETDALGKCSDTAKSAHGDIDSLLSQRREERRLARARRLKKRYALRKQERLESTAYGPCGVAVLPHKKICGSKSDIGDSKVEVVEKGQDCQAIPDSRMVIDAKGGVSTSSCDLPFEPSGRSVSQSVSIQNNLGSPSTKVKELRESENYEVHTDSNVTQESHRSTSNNDADGTVELSHFRDDLDNSSGGLNASKSELCDSPNHVFSLSQDNTQSPTTAVSKLEQTCYNSDGQGMSVEVQDNWPPFKQSKDDGNKCIASIDLMRTTEVCNNNLLNGEARMVSVEHVLAQDLSKQSDLQPTEISGPTENCNHVQVREITDGGTRDDQINRMACFEAAQECTSVALGSSENSSEPMSEERSEVVGYVGIPEEQVSNVPAGLLNGVNSTELVAIPNGTNSSHCNEICFNPVGGVGTPEEQVSNVPEASLTRVNSTELVKTPNGTEISYPNQDDSGVVVTPEDQLSNLPEALHNGANSTVLRQTPIGTNCSGLSEPCFTTVRPKEQAGGNLAASHDRLNSDDFGQTRNEANNNGDCPSIVANSFDDDDSFCSDISIEDPYATDSDDPSYHLTFEPNPKIAASVRLNVGGNDKADPLASSSGCRLQKVLPRRIESLPASRPRGFSLGRTRLNPVDASPNPPQCLPISVNARTTKFKSRTTDVERGVIIGQMGVSQVWKKKPPPGADHKYSMAPSLEKSRVSIVPASFGVTRLIGGNGDGWRQNRETLIASGKANASVLGKARNHHRAQLPTGKTTLEQNAYRSSDSDGDPDIEYQPRMGKSNHEQKLRPSRGKRLCQRKAKKLPSNQFEEFSRQSLDCDPMADRVGSNQIADPLAEVHMEQDPLGDGPLQQFVMAKPILEPPNLTPFILNGTSDVTHQNPIDSLGGRKRTLHFKIAKGKITYQGEVGNPLPSLTSPGGSNQHFVLQPPEFRQIIHRLPLALPGPKKNLLPTTDSASSAEQITDDNRTSKLNPLVEQATQNVNHLQQKTLRPPTPPEEVRTPSVSPVDPVFSEEKLPIGKDNINWKGIGYFPPPKVGKLHFRIRRRLFRDTKVHRLFYRRLGRPPYSYPEIAAMAIENDPMKSVRFSTIVDFAVQNFRFFTLPQFCKSKYWKKTFRVAVIESNYFRMDHVGWHVYFSFKTQYRLPTDPAMFENTEEVPTDSGSEGEELPTEEPSAELNPLVPICEYSDEEMEAAKESLVQHVNDFLLLSAGDDLVALADVERATSLESAITPMEPPGSPTETPVESAPPEGTPETDSNPSQISAACQCPKCDFASPDGIQLLWHVNSVH